MDFGFRPSTVAPPFVFICGERPSPRRRSDLAHPPLHINMEPKPGPPPKRSFLYNWWFLGLHVDLQGSMGTDSGKLILGGNSTPQILKLSGPRGSSQITQEMFMLTPQHFAVSIESSCTHAHRYGRPGWQGSSCLARVFELKTPATKHTSRRKFCLIRRHNRSSRGC